MSPPRPRSAKGKTPKSQFRPRTKIQQLTSDLFMCWCVAHGLPKPEREYKFHPLRRFRFDYAWPDTVALEVEGGVFTGGRHTRGAGFVRDMEKYNLAALEGWKVLRYTPQQLTSEQALQDLKQALGLTS